MNEIQVDLISQNTILAIKNNVATSVGSTIKSNISLDCSIPVKNVFTSPANANLVDDIYYQILFCGLSMLGVSGLLEPKFKFEESLRELLKSYKISNISKNDSNYMEHILKSGFLLKNYDPLFVEKGRFIKGNGSNGYVCNSFKISPVIGENVLSIELNSDFVSQIFGLKIRKTN